MTEKKYIEVEAAIAETRKPRLTDAELRRRLASIPAADVRPVVRGKWIEDWETGCSECSACHDGFLWEDYKGVAEWNFCPNCGAMIEKADKI